MSNYAPQHDPRISGADFEGGADEWDQLLNYFVDMSTEARTDLAALLRTMHQQVVNTLFERQTYGEVLTFVEALQSAVEGWT